MCDYIEPIDTSQLAVGDSMEQQTKATLFNRLKRELANIKKCWLCSRLHCCTGYVNKTKYPNMVCDVIKNDENLHQLFQKYHNLKTKE